MSNYLQAIKFNEQGLVPVTAIDVQSKVIYMQAWMNAEALQETIKSKQMVYFSRSKNRLWKKGESSGHLQNVHALYLDCDGDSIVAEIEQVGGIACHTGHQSCFYRKLSSDGQWLESQSRLKSTEEIYGQD